jgi:predicted secreted protein
MAGLDAFGTAFQMGDGAAPEVFTALANCTGITPPGIERETIDVTSHGSPEQWMEFIAGLKNGGEVSLELNYDPREHDVPLQEQLASDGDPRNFKIVWPKQLGEWSFAAVMTGFAPDAPYDDKLSAEVKFQVSGKPTMTPGV